MGTTTKTIFSSFLLCSLLLHLYFSEGVVAQEVVAKSESEALGEPEKRETLEIIIGGGGSPAPSPEAPCPPPPPKLNRLDRARRALLNFKNLIDDPNCYTQNWNDQTDTCDFNGIRCATYPTDKQRAVAGVDLNGARVTGQNGCALPLSSLLGQSQIPELTFFHVNSNGFAGSVPSDVINFPYFFELDLSNNKVKGQFPLDAIKSNQLVFLDLRFNELTGPIPFQLFQKDLDFDGCLPIEIGNLKKAVVFDVSKNSLTGPIPLSFGCLKSIQYLNLANNKFYGCVPDNLCQIPSLRNNGNLSLANNYFNELGPSCWSLIKSKVLDVSKNCIHGLPNQRSPTECYYFYKTKKTCPNPSSFYTVPCKSHWGKPSSETNVPTSAPVTYKALKPHRLRL
ncbi:hypothetical protein LR48_Vigan09g071000 [Vigna angularis]|uniref:Cell wall hydroxyproline-rich glycoprotein n=1 Tax=Phaseolus angularis TaxID=3914 RepID=A0A0L9VAG1_PHAAN|nr:hypothetical protein LR48_Vigan09g071000 [Vigna angularis]